MFLRIELAHDGTRLSSPSFISSTMEETLASPHKRDRISAVIFRDELDSSPGAKLTLKFHFTSS